MLHEGRVSRALCKKERRNVVLRLSVRFAAVHQHEDRIGMPVRRINWLRPKSNQNRGDNCCEYGCHDDLGTSAHRETSLRMLAKRRARVAASNGSSLSGGTTWTCPFRCSTTAVNTSFRRAASSQYRVPAPLSVKTAFTALVGGPPTVIMRRRAPRYSKIFP